ncbi:hypothetical protein [Bradyrhizobium zhanjiangense]|uniref:hypothetical protein n=1 Tax=Bradyrhizobium zhanjiangense TaxID=1325107 RepID=UPI001008DAB7|nr:hypothetical protein [Bradyrhizobium zhanjiangense]
MEIVDFQVSLERAVRQRGGIAAIHSDELVAEFPEQARSMRNPLAMRVGVSHKGRNRSPDQVGLAFERALRSAQSSDDASELTFAIDKTV